MKDEINEIIIELNKTRSRLVTIVSLDHPGYRCELCKPPQDLMLPLAHVSLGCTTAGPTTGSGG